MSVCGDHALVLGGSMAGLLAARALSEHYRKVTVVERDSLLNDAEPRRGVPQGRHSHGLLASGQRALEALFPGFSAGAKARGGMFRDIGDSCDWHVGGVHARRVHSGVDGLLLSRPALEAYVRELVLARGNVAIETGQVARGLIGDRRRVTGARMLARDVEAREQNQQSEPRTLAADLVVDASGRGSQLPRWLKELGAAVPREQSVRADVVYTSCFVRRKSTHFNGDYGYIVTPAAPARRGAAVLALEGERFIVTLSGYLGEPGPSDFAGMLEYARGMGSERLVTFLSDAEPLSEPVQMRDPESRWRRYDRLSSFPEGLLVCGDALSCFNPAYAQGMTVAALEARALLQCLRAGSQRLPPRYFRAAAKVVAAAWSIAVVADFAFEGVTGERPWGTPLLNAYVARLHRAASRDADVALARLRVTHLLAPPSTLLSPRILARVFRYGGPAVSSAPGMALSVESSVREP
jgi:2-polyprenyl-6-methoxyphenol hydroxylase-like FAD-dependent oxidoreductase